MSDTPIIADAAAFVPEIYDPSAQVAALHGGHGWTKREIVSPLSRLECV